VVEQSRVLRLRRFTGYNGRVKQRTLGHCTLGSPAVCSEGRPQLVPARASGVSERSVPRKQLRGMLLLELLQGYAIELVVEQSRVLRLRRFTDRSGRVERRLGH